MIPLFKVFMAPGVEHNLAKVLHSGQIAQGPQVERFEIELRKHLEAPWDVLTVNSGTSAIELALYLAGVRWGDHVITTPMTCSATNGAILRVGGVPVWADVFPRTGLIDPESVAKLVTNRTKAIVAVDWGGAPCDYISLRELGLPIIEDAAHAFGAKIDGVPIAVSGGDYVCWSFQAIKHLTTGDGGLLKTPEDQVERGRKLRWFGLDRRSRANFRSEQLIAEIGFKMHMNDIAATIGLENIQYTKSLIEMARSNAGYYSNELSLESTMTPPNNGDSSWWLYTLLVRDRESFEQQMRDAGIETSRVHSRNDEHPGFLKCRKFDPLLGVDFFAKHEVAIPVGWWVDEEHREHIASTVKKLDGHI